MSNTNLEFDTNNKTKKNHIVPQVYLRFFRKSDKSDICVFDKVKKDYYITNTSNVGSENKLYVIEENSSTSYMSWEDYYTKYVDGTINEVFREIIQNTECRINIKPLWNYELKLKVINIISHQILRTREKIYSYYDEYPEELDKIFQDERIKKIKDQNEVNKFKEMLKQESIYKSFALFMVNRVANNDKIKNVLLNRTWTIFCNKTNFDFITSDTPIVLYDYKEKIASTQNGIAGETTLLAYPLTPKYMIVIFPNDFYFGGLKLLYDNSRIEVHEEKVVKFYNKLQIDNCTKQIFAKRNEDLLNTIL